jgi:thioredoxin 1
MNNLKKSITLLLLVALASCGSASKSTDGSTPLDPISFQGKMDEIISFTLLDVRTPEEFAMNHLDGAKNIDVNAANFAEMAVHVDKTKPVMVYCKSGGRSATASAMLREMGYTVYELEGGILKWQSVGLPLAANGSKNDDGYSLARYSEEIAASPLVLVDFQATWCGPCRMMAPHIEALKEKYNDQLTVLKVDTDKSAEVSQHFGISGIPLVKLYKNGKEVYDKTGYHSQEELQALLDKYL